MRPSPSTPLLSRLSAVAAVALAIGAVAACARSVDDGPLVEQPLFGPDATTIARDFCVQTECPAPLATCPSSAGLCTTDTSRDVDNCGACGAACPRQARGNNATTLCTGGECAYACDELAADCNKDPKDGCEVAVASDPKNCGGCGLSCDPGDLCWRGACGCPSGFTRCGDDCKNLQSDMLNCGACNKVCVPPSSGDPRWTCGPDVQPPNTDWSCASADCTIQCKPTFGNCNEQLCGDGCETDLSADPNNCGACGKACEAGQSCVDGACLCPTGTTRCGSRCVDLRSDPNNCGSCYEECPGPSRSPGGGPQCTGGICSYVCFEGYADCNSRIFDGCETNIGSDPLHCGSCSTQCETSAGQPCVAGSCLTKPCPPPDPVN